MDTYFRTTSYALVVTAFVALAVTGELDALSIMLYAGAVGVSFYRDTRGVKRFRLREWMWRVLAILYIPFIFVDAAFFSNRILALVHMTLFASAAKLFQNKRDRDWVFLYLVALFQMLLAAGLTFNATFVGSLAVFLFFFISTLAAFEIRRARREVSSHDEEVITPTRPARRFKYRANSQVARPGENRVGRVRYLVGASMAQVILVAALTLPFFFLIPRLSGGGVARGFGEEDAITGFSKTVELGEVASIKKSTRIVMHVQLDRKPQRYMRWRGIALDRYDGRRWSLDTSVERAIDSRTIRHTEGYDINAPFDRPYTLDSIPPADPQSVVEQKIMLEPLSTDTLFAAPRVLTLRGSLESISKDRYTGALTAARLRGRTSYAVRSDVSVPVEENLRTDSPALSDDMTRKLYLQLTRKLDPRVSRLAREITHSAPTAYDKARAIENYLKTRFRYTLDLKRTDKDPLAEFLFETQEGHCEYFATAMVIMLRTLDIPARIVNGFQMGEYNDLNDLYTVRESDAHSWVEAYFPRNNAWVEFDPTPSAGINDYSRGGLMSRLRKFMDAAEVFWLDYIVTLDSEQQASIMVDLQHRLMGLKDRAFRYYLAVRLWVASAVNSLIIEHRWRAADAIKLAVTLGVLLTLMLALYVTASYLKRREVAPTGYGPWWHRLFILPLWRRSRLLRGNSRASAVLFYEQMLQVASRAGLIKQPDQTPTEFAALSGFNQIHEITRVYNRVRFGGAQLDEAEARRVSSLLVELKRAVRKK